MTRLAASDVVIGRSWMRVHGVHLDMEKSLVRVKEVSRERGMLEEIDIGAAILQGLTGEGCRTHEDIEN